MADEIDGQPPEETKPAPTNTDDGADNNQVVDEAEIKAGIIHDEARYSLMQEDYNTAADKIHDDFEATLEANPSTLFSEDELEILASDSNIAGKNKMLRGRFEKYRDEKLNLKKDEMVEFEKELKGRKGQLDILSQSNKFSKENPDVDMDSLADFIQEDLSPRKKKEFLDTAETKADFLKLAHDEYKKLNPSENGDDDLPPDLSGVNGASGDGSQSPAPEQEAYLKSIGIGR